MAAQPAGHATPTNYALRPPVGIDQHLGPGPSGGGPALRNRWDIEPIRGCTSGVGLFRTFSGKETEIKAHFSFMVYSEAEGRGYFSNGC